MTTAHNRKNLIGEFEKNIFFKLTLKNKGT